jgi:hypothetical protein
MTVFGLFGLASIAIPMGFLVTDEINNYFKGCHND